LIFFLNLPVGALAMGILTRVVRSPRPVVPFDWAGQISAVVALAAFTFGVIEGGSLGFASPGILGAFGVAVASFTIFLLAGTAAASLDLRPSRARQERSA
jgi:MFS transporter, DHA2 family, methylenomycin A resistance protein